jgi:hypothetical protein
MVYFEIICYAHNDQISVNYFPPEVGRISVSYKEDYVFPSQFGTGYRDIFRGFPQSLWENSVVSYVVVVVIAVVATAAESAPV